jgi:hypothetical protein
MNTSTIVSIDWLGVFKLAGAVFTSLRGGTVIALAIIRYTSDRIAEGLKSKYLIINPKLRRNWIATKPH